MASHFMPYNAHELAELLAPASATDAAALIAVGLASTAYLLRGIAWDRPDPYQHIWFERPQLQDGATTRQPKATRNIAEKLDEANKDIVIFWGSQSGTAESFANRLARECQVRFGIAALSADLSDYDAHTISLIPTSKLAVFVLSTFGEGDPSDNATGFWEWLHQESRAEVRLPNLRYAAFGLGNSNYKYYNRVLDDVVRAFDGAGAQRLILAGKADAADGSTEEAFHAWKDKLYDVVFRQQLGLEDRHVVYTPGLCVVEDPSLSPIDQQKGLSGLGAKARSTLSLLKDLKIQCARELCTSPEVRCLHLELDLAEHPELRYRTGDHLAVFPVNPDAEVQLLLRGIGMDEVRAAKPLLITALEQGVQLNLPSPTTALALFRHYLEVCAPVSQDTILELSTFAPTLDARDLLLRIGKDKESYATFVASTHVTIGRLLSLAAPDTAWTDLPLSYLLETIPPIQPRYYSIASSSAVSPKSVAITIAVQDTPLPGDSTIKIPGLTSHYLLAQAESLNRNTTTTTTIRPSDSQALSQNTAPPEPMCIIPGQHRLFASVRQSKFKLPVLGITPVVMVAAGTGIAPFRGFILERARLRAVGKPVGRMILFFGCRWHEGDCLYREELRHLVRDMEGILEIVMAFSREGGDGNRYVQHKVKERGDDVCKMLSEGANLYICGRATMARDVGRVVEELMQERNRWSEVDVHNWSRLAKKDNKWQQDVWA